MTPTVWLYSTVLNSIQRFLFLLLATVSVIQNSLSRTVMKMMMMMKMMKMFYQCFIYRKLRQKWPGAGWGRETYQPQSSPTIAFRTGMLSTSCSPPRTLPACLSPDLTRPHPTRVQCGPGWEVLLLTLREIKLSWSLIFTIISQSNFQTRSKMQFY